MEATARECDVHVAGEAHVAIVKNTFIQVLEPGCRSARRSSLPASLHLCDFLFDTSSDTSFVASSVSPASCHPERERAETWCVPCINLQQSTVQSSMSSEQSASVVEKFACARPKGKLGSCQPHHKARIQKAIRRVAEMLSTCGLVTQVDIDEDTLTISVHVATETLKQQALAQAQKTLLEVTTQSKCVYIMGYASTNPFRLRADGFEATVGLMENATRACWHVFKKGFCRHGVTCNKQHPVFEVPLQVSVMSDVSDIFCF
mmetsp:Transcript_27101/g.42110  ORF Transcript_27101/g.42110 Transcript_27101/m.42110 type:complete len:261 (+) Transcript_27101:48-830(+)